MAFTDNLKSLAPVDAIERMELYDPSGAYVAQIENRPGQQGSLAVYQHLASRHGSISTEAAREGLALYAEHTEDARLHPGKHPNIDRLIAVENGGPPLAIRTIPKQ